MAGKLAGTLLLFLKWVFNDNAEAHAKSIIVKIIILPVYAGSCGAKYLQSNPAFIIKKEFSIKPKIKKLRKSRISYVGQVVLFGIDQSCHNLY